MINFQEKFLKNKYTKWYMQIINKALLENRVKLKYCDDNYIYYERHHILPKSIYPEYKSIYKFKWNIVLLTLREHFLCHHLLTKMFSEKSNISKMYRAWKLILKYNKLKMTENREKIYKSFKTWYKHSDETKVKMSKAKKGIPLSESHKKSLKEKRSYMYTEERSEKLIKALKGRKLDKSHYENVCNAINNRSIEIKKVIYSKVSDKLKIVAQNRTPEQIKKAGDAKKGKIAISKNNTIKYIGKEDFIVYQINGWEMGFPKREIKS